VARDLGVRYVLEGSLQRSCERVRVTAQLIDGFEETHVRAERYDRELSPLKIVRLERVWRSRRSPAASTGSSLRAASHKSVLGGNVI
jgi:adenylate cyclase